MASNNAVSNQDIITDSVVKWKPYYIIDPDTEERVQRGWVSKPITIMKPTIFFAYNLEASHCMTFNRTASTHPCKDLNSVWLRPTQCGCQLTLTCQHNVREIKIPGTYVLRFCDDGEGVNEMTYLSGGETTQDPSTLVGVTYITVDYPVVMSYEADSMCCK